MKRQAETLLLKNKLRLMKGTIRHSWQGIIGVLVIGGVLLYKFFSVVVKVGYGTGVTTSSLFYTLLLVAVTNLFRVFINQTPVFRIEAASLLHTFNTGFFRKSLLHKQFLSVLSSILISGILAWLLSGFTFSLFFFKLWGTIAFYLCNCTFLSWVFYHVQRKFRWCVFLFFCLCTFLLLVHSVLAVAILAILLCVVWIYVRRFLRMNMSKYFERIRILEAASVALSQNDYARMGQMAEENRPSYVRGPMLYHMKLTKQTALWSKSLMDLFRMQKQVLVLLALLLLAGWIVSRTSLFAFMPLLDDSTISRVVAVFCTTIALSSLYQLLVKQAKTISDKRKLGLSLPYSTKQIIVSYGMTATILNLLLTLAISLLFANFSTWLILLLFAEIIAYLIPCLTQLYETKFQRGALAFSNMILFAAVYGFLMNCQV